MQVAVKPEIKTPLPQRAQKTQGGGNVAGANKTKPEPMDGPAEKKARPNPGVQGPNQNGNTSVGPGGNQNQKNFGANNNRGFGNRTNNNNANNNRVGNRGGGGGNRSNFQNNQQNQNQPNPNQQNQNQQNQKQQNQSPQNQKQQNQNPQNQKQQNQNPQNQIQNQPNQNQRNQNPQNQNQQNQNQRNQNPQNQNQPNQNQRNQNPQNQNQPNQNQRNDVKPLFAGGNNPVKAEVAKPQQPQQNTQVQNNPQQNAMNQNQNQNRGGGGGGGDRGDRSLDRGGDHRGAGDRGGDHRGGGGDRGNRGNRGGMGGDRGGERGGRGGNFQIQNMGGRGDDFFIGQRLRAISGPTHELPPIEINQESKFSGRNRLYVGNLTNDVNENELREIFKPFGEIGEVFHNPEKNFAFLKMDFYANAEKAKRELDGTLRKGRPLRVRFAPNSTILRVKNLTSVVSNELLYTAFEVFGPVERAYVVVDDRGKSTGEGVVEFAKKSSANACLRMCSDKCFFLTSSLRPCVVENFDNIDDADGLPEKSLNKKTPEFNQLRSVGPRFADPSSFEHEYGTRWKQLLELFRNKQEALKNELRMEEEKLEAQMEYARYEHETEMLRQELRKREQDNERKKMEWEMREKQAEELRKRQEDDMRRQQGEMQSRMLRQEEEMRRRQQENTLFMQAQQLNSLLDQQEGFGSGNSGGNNFDNFGGANNSPFDFRGGSGGPQSNQQQNQLSQLIFALGGIPALEDLMDSIRGGNT